MLVAYASRMGSTREIAEAVADRLRSSGLSVDVRACVDDPDPTGYAGVVVGSAVYVRRWLPGARAFLRGTRGAADRKHLAVPERTVRSGRGSPSGSLPHARSAVSRHGWEPPR